MRRAKHIPFLPFLLASLLVASGALAQAAQERQTETEREPARNIAISAARSPYIQNAEADSIFPDADSGSTLAQLSRSRPSRPFPSRRGYPRGGYQSPWMDHGNAGHAVIGAVIGFGLGAAVGAKANTSPYPGTTARAVVLFGSFGALIGAAVGAAHGGPYPFAHHRRSHPPLWRKGMDEEPDLSADCSGSYSIGFHPEGRPAE